MAQEAPTINGKPAVKIHVDVREKIGLANYSNVEIGSSVSRYVEDNGPEGDKEALGEAYKTLESFMMEFREDLLELVQKGG